MSGNLKARITNTRLQFVGVGIILAFVLLVTMYFTSEKKVPLPWEVEDHPGVPKGPPLTGVYLTFDTSKYTKSDGSIFIPPDEVLHKLNLAELEELYFRYQESMQVACSLQRHVGDEFDGGYHICEPYVQKNACLAYSFGSKKEFSFDDGLVSLFGCKVHSFVPTEGPDDHKHLPEVTFHELGISHRNETVKRSSRIFGVYNTFERIRYDLGHSNTKVDIVKMNIRGREWATLRQMLDEKTLQKAGIKTLIVNFRTVNERRDVQSYIYMLTVLRDLYDAGFRRFMFKMYWHQCLILDMVTKLERTGCHEAHFLKI